MTQHETNSFPKRAKRYAKVSGAAARVGAQYGLSSLFSSNKNQNAVLLRAALGGLKGPLMKIAQIVATIPDLLPPDYAAELATLQSDAPSMGWPFVRRRMAAELGGDWQTKFQSFERKACAAASLGQVHKAIGPDGAALACKLQYPDMSSVVEADLQQLKIIFSLFEKFDGTVQTQPAFEEVAVRLREELDYKREAHNMRLYGKMLADVEGVHVPQPQEDLSSSRLLTMSWMQGDKMIDAIGSRNQEERNSIAMNMFRLWYAPLYNYGILHGDPHMGNYTVREDNSINLLDYGCIRIFEPRIVQAIVCIYEALQQEDEEKLVAGYELWGFKNLSKELIETLSLWARFVYAPVLDNRVRAMSETNTTSYGREVAGKIHRSLKELGGVTMPPEFIMIDRASIGLGGLFLRLDAKVNWCELFQELIQDFSVETLAKSQKELLDNTSSFKL